jgi:hypothetical protein
LPSLEHGLSRAIVETIQGFVIITFLNAIFTVFDYNVGILYLIIRVIAIGGVLELLNKMKYWSSTYLTGYIFGLALLYLINMIDFTEFVVFLAVGGLYLLRRYSK